MLAYYNEIDPYCVQWLKNLIAAEVLPMGVVDDRPIQEVQPCDLEPYTQCHFFAGLGGWAYALQLGEWPEERQVWTGSCPCQPFSAAGKRRGTDDERHLWPEFARLIGECSPATIFGEQVASKDGKVWLSGVRSDLEGMGYAVGAADLCAASAGAPHIRQRLWWVAGKWMEYAPSNGRQYNSEIGRGDGAGDRKGGAQFEFGNRRLLSGLAHSLSPRLEERPSITGDVRSECPASVGSSDAGGASACGVGLTECHTGNTGGSANQPGECNEAPGSRASVELGRSGDFSFWTPYDLIPCLDGKARRTQPGLQPLAHGVPARVGKLRAYGNAIVAQVAAEFIAAYLETEAAAACEII